MGIKERRVKILLALYLLSSGEMTPVVFTQAVQLVFDLSFNQKTRGTLSAMMREGLIEKYVDGGSAANNANGEEDRTKYRLTDKGWKNLCLEFPFFRFLFDKWDGRWRVLSYEIPEKKRDLRDRLRREVAGWGLGPWHRSFWLTPHPIVENLRDLVAQKEEEKYIQAFESEHVFGDRQMLIEKVWGKSELEKKYRSMFKLWHDILSQDGEKPLKLQRVIGAYVELLRRDPGLPRELNGENWIGFEAFNIFKEIKAILLS